MPTTCPVCFRPIPAGAAYCNGDSCGEAAPRDLAEKPRQAPRVVNGTSAASPPLDWLPSAPPPPSPVIDWLPPVPPTPPPPPTVVETVSSAPVRTVEATPLPPPPPPEPRGEQSRSRIPWRVLLAAAPVAALMLTAVIILASSEEKKPPAPPRPQPEAKAPRSTEPLAVVALDPGSKATPAEIPPPKPPAKPATQHRPVAPQPASLPTPQLGEPELLVPAFSRPEVEVVFCLDTTGSMGGLLDGAKKKIWSICNQIAGGRPVPEPRVGLVAYRDRGDAYVAKVFDLTRDLDAVHANLEGLSAGGGGDTPESVNQALDDAVNKIKWSTDKHTLRIIFLVGDAPPHMDYADDVKYQVTCDRAKKRGIIINTIQCGNDARCRSTWQEIGLLAGGEYAAIPQAGGARFVRTPFDDRLAAINKELLGTVLLYGLPARRRGEERLRTAARAMRGAAAADRAAFMGKSGKVAAYDLLDAIKERRVKLETIAVELLPAELRKRKTLAERRVFLDDLAKRRAVLFKEAVELDRKRAAFTARELGAGGKDSFDSQVLKMLRKQAAKFEIAY